MLSIAEEMNINKDAKVRIIGICIETRPDAILDSSIDGDPYFWIKFFRKTGTTRVQLGAQHVNNYILRNAIVVIRMNKLNRQPNFFKTIALK